jgi:predicted nucleic acid-binding Zn finger protein
MADKPIARMWVFASESNPNKKYQTLQYVDGSTSCQCMGWCRKVTIEGLRSCRHTRSIDAGTANSECISSVDYTNTNKPNLAIKLKTNNNAPEAPLKRKIRW